MNLLISIISSSIQRFSKQEQATSISQHSSLLYTRCTDLFLRSRYPKFSYLLRTCFSQNSTKCLRLSPSNNLLFILKYVKAVNPIYLSPKLAHIRCHHTSPMHFRPKVLPELSSLPYSLAGPILQENSLHDEVDPHLSFPCR